MTAYLALTAASRQRLQQQAELNGVFHHTLTDGAGLSVLATVTIEQCERAIEVNVTIGEHSCTVTITLDRRHPDNHHRIARFITGEANGYIPSGLLEVGEHELISNMESSLRHALQLGRGTHYLPLDDIEVCLLLHRSPHGIDCRLEGQGATVHFRLPFDRRRAYTRLHETVRQFVQGVRLAGDVDLASAAGF
ncbi:hypothetical protein ACQCLI_13065 [Pseudomonas nitroreducens]|uniref:hypothetical protein n=1 Tax=Pseudomonas nitroreducens TaxID=46680 RepID=UPI0002F00BD0|nr:hypothetical protein [Pseudomonas nitroreducens]